MIKKPIKLLILFTVLLLALAIVPLALAGDDVACDTRVNNTFEKLLQCVTLVSEEWLKRCRQTVDRLERKLDEFNMLLTDNEIFIARARGVGVMTWQEMANYCITGPNIRAAGLKYDIRRAEPYSIYESFDFDVPTYKTGDVYDRYLQRRDEMRESVKILRQALDRIPRGEVRPGKKVWNPKVPPGEWYARVEHPKGELGFYLVSDGGTNAYRYHVRIPSFINLGALERIAAMVARRDAKPRFRPEVPRRPAGAAVRPRVAARARAAPVRRRRTPSRRAGHARPRATGSRRSAS